VDGDEDLEAMIRDLREQAEATGSAEAWATVARLEADLRSR